jgi:hypothetical protein
VTPIQSVVLPTFRVPRLRKALTAITSSEINALHSSITQAMQWDEATPLDMPHPSRSRKMAKPSSDPVTHRFYYQCPLRQGATTNLRGLAGIQSDTATIPRVAAQP